MVLQWRVIPAHLYASGVYIQQTKDIQQQKDQKELSRLASKAFSTNQHPRQPITTFQAPSVDRLHGDHDSQIAATLRAGALKLLRHRNIESLSEMSISASMTSLSLRPW